MADLDKARDDLLAAVAALADTLAARDGIRGSSEARLLLTTLDAFKEARKTQEEKSTRICTCCDAGAMRQINNSEWICDKCGAQIWEAAFSEGDD